MEQFNVGISNALLGKCGSISGDANENLVDIYDNQSSYFAYKSEQSAERAERAADKAVEAASSSSNVTMNDLLELKSDLMFEIGKKKDEGDYALEENIPQKLSELENDTDYFPTSETDKALMKALPLEDTFSDKILQCNGEKLYWNDIETLLEDSTAITQKQITNCLLELPQRVKATLVDGLLSIKSGSIAIVPNGFENDGITPKFDYEIIETDLAVSSSANSQMMVFKSSDNNLVANEVVTFVSGNVQPTGLTMMCWYDVTNNVVKYTTNSGSNWSEGNSLPFGLITADTSKIVSIDQIFNGIGYIGSTIWVDKGVKGLIPNGRNENGTLNNIKWNTDSVVTTTFSETANSNVYIYFDGKALSKLTDASVVYDSICNINKYANEQYPFIKIADNVKISNGKISNFVPQKTFRALDYNDSQQIISGYFPDLSASISISNGQSFAQNGWIYVHCPRVISGNSTVKLNNILVYEKVDTDHQNGYHTVSNTSWIPYSRNSVITTSGNFTSLIFYPVKGVK